MRKQLAKTIYNIYHNDVIKAEKYISKIEYLTKSEIESYQLRKLNLLLDYAYKYVPFYKIILNSIGFGCKGLKSIDDLKKLPIISKNELRKNFNLFIPKKEIKFTTGRTSGSTGEPLIYRKCNNCKVIEMALGLRFAKNMGIKIEDRKLLIWGGIKMNSYNKMIRYIKNYIYNYDVYNNYNINKDSITKLLNKLYKNKYLYYRSYPSTLALVAREINNKQQIFNNCPKVISVSVETLMESDRNIIEKVFGKIVYTQNRCEV